MVNTGAIDGFRDPRFPAGIVAGLVAWRTNNVLATLAVGMGLVVLLPNL